MEESFFEQVERITKGWIDFFREPFQEPLFVEKNLSKFSRVHDP